VDGIELGHRVFSSGRRRKVSDNTLRESSRYSAGWRCAGADRILAM
jgi:hypothetical protein